MLAEYLAGGKTPDFLEGSEEPMEIQPQKVVEEPMVTEPQEIVQPVVREEPKAEVKPEPVVEEEEVDEGLSDWAKKIRAHMVYSPEPEEPKAEKPMETSEDPKAEEPMETTEQPVAAEGEAPQEPAASEPVPQEASPEETVPKTPLPEEFPVEKEPEIVRY